MKILLDSSGWIEFFTGGPLADRYAVYLALWTAVLLQQPLAPAIVLAAVALAAAQALWHYTLIRFRTRDGCFQAFRLNHWLGFTVFAGVVGGYAPTPGIWPWVVALTVSPRTHTGKTGGVGGGIGCPQGGCRGHRYTES